MDRAKFDSKTFVLILFDVEKNPKIRTYSKMTSNRPYLIASEILLPRDAPQQEKYQVLLTQIGFFLFRRPRFQCEFNGNHCFKRAPARHPKATEGVEIRECWSIWEEISDNVCKRVLLNNFYNQNSKFELANAAKISFAIQIEISTRSPQKSVF